MATKERIQSLVQQLEAASDAYYNSQNVLMSDEAYDALRDELERLDPRNPFLARVGAKVPGGLGVVRLPVKMPSLQKIKPGTGQVESFARRGPCRSWILSEKLDGLSLLWESQSGALYLRGDGVQGVSLSNLAPSIAGLRKTKNHCLIRGELLVRKCDAPKDCPLLRSWINGLVHQKQPDASALRLLRFVAYEVLEPRGLTRSQQLAWLLQEKFEVPWCMSTDQLTDESLKEVLLERRTDSPYEMDGIVVAEDAVPWVQSAEYDALQEASLPKDMRAFKMPLQDQCAETVVVALHWATSHHGYIIPRMEIRPVQVAGATIQFVTAHNARFVLENGLGPGARIEIRRSGDVIPTLHRVLQKAEPVFPTAGTWEWAGDATSAVHIRFVGDGAANQELQGSRLTHFVRTMGVEDCGPGLIAKLVEAGVGRVCDLVALTEGRFQEIVGKKNGSKLHQNLRTCLQKATEQDFLLASSVLPRGMGHTKTTVLFAAEADIRKWRALAGRKLDGWSETSLQELLTTLPAYFQWRSNELADIPLRIATVAPMGVPLGAGQTKGTVCFSGFRDKTLEAACGQRGWLIADSVSKKTNLLVVPDGEENSDTSKAKKARDLGLRIMGRSAFQTELLKSG